MNKLHALSLFGAGITLGLVPLFLSAQAAAPMTQATKITGKTLMPAADMKWVPMPGLEGAQQVALWGDSTKEAHRILYKWPAGTKAPLHTHTNGDRGVVTSGTLSLAVDGAPPKMLPSGSYFSLGAGVPHATAVEGNSACVFFIEREGPFDVHMVEASK